MVILFCLLSLCPFLGCKTPCRRWRRRQRRRLRVLCLRGESPLVLKPEGGNYAVNQHGREHERRTPFAFGSDRGFSGLAECWWAQVGQWGFFWTVPCLSSSDHGPLWFLVAWRNEAVTWHQLRLCGCAYLLVSWFRDRYYGVVCLVVDRI